MMINKTNSFKKRVSPLYWLLMIIGLLFINNNTIDAKNRALEEVRTLLEQAKEAIENDDFLGAYMKASQAKSRLNSESDLEVEETFEIAAEYLAIVEKITERIEDVSGKQLFYQLEIESYELMFAICDELYQKTTKELYFTTAFQLAEKHRNLLLFNTLGFGENDFSDSLKAIEGKYLSEITLLNDSLEVVKRNEKGNGNFVSQLEQKRDDFQTKYETFLEQNKSKTSPVKSLETIVPIQQNLDSDEAFVIYFYGQKAIYSLIITDKDKSFVRLQTDKLPSEIDEMIFSVVEKLHSEKEQEAITDLETLYEIVFQPLEKKLGKRKKLQIVADGALSALPFDALLTKKTVDWDFDFKKLPFLIYHYQIAYQHSATTFIRQKKQRAIIQNPKVLLFAPKFGKTEFEGEQLKELKQSKNLIQNLEQNWIGNYLENETATLTELYQPINYNIIHFATHTLVNDDSPLNSKIVLADKCLILRDLYQIDLESNLAILGSCRTGSGKYQVGVGRVGMAYGFYLAGVKSLVYSLWEVDETATNRLLLAFYDNLKAGFPKDEALHLAKIHYLQNANEIMADPYYWSGFVLQGETSQFEFEQNQSKRWILWIGISVFVLLLIAYFRRQQN